MYGDPATDNLAEALSTGTPAWWTLNVESQFELSETLRAQVESQTYLICTTSHFLLEFQHQVEGYS